MHLHTSCYMHSCYSASTIAIAYHAVPQPPRALTFRFTSRRSSLSPIAVTVSSSARYAGGIVSIIPRDLYILIYGSRLPCFRDNLTAGQCVPARSFFPSVYLILRRVVSAHRENIVAKMTARCCDVDNRDLKLRYIRMSCAHIIIKITTL